ncbi:MAG TPA: DUF6160 family protein [Smithella sp.]|nr:DUF6160 family protein [Smithella sp.]
MKKVLLLAVVALFVMMPFASFAMTTISDSDMSTITAQEGVSIYLDNISLTGMSMTASWGQANISGTAGLPGSNSPITNFGFDQGGFVGADVTVGNISVNGLLTIDVGTNNLTTTGTWGSSASGAVGLPGGIQLGLSNIKLSVGAMQMIIKVGSEETLKGTTTVTVYGTAFPGVNSWMTMGTAYVSGLNTTVNGTIFISTH